MICELFRSELVEGQNKRRAKKKRERAGAAAVAAAENRRKRKGSKTAKGKGKARKIESEGVVGGCGGRVTDVVGGSGSSLSLSHYW